MDVESVARIIMLDMQCHDFGHTNARGDFRTTAKKIELLERQAKAAARAVLAALSPQEGWYGPHGWLIKPHGLTEEDWYLSFDPCDDPDVTSVPLFAKEDQKLGEPAAPTPPAGGKPE